MKRALSTLSLLACAGLVGPAVHAQSLAEIAKAEASRRKSESRPVKVYTNEDLSGTLVAPPAPPAKPAPAPQGAAAPDQKDGKPDEKTTEAYWKARASTLRQSLARNALLVDAMQSRINALTTEVLNAHDPAQEAASQKSLTVATHELERLKQETQKATQELASLEEEARKANVPPGWLR